MDNCQIPELKIERDAKTNVHQFKLIEVYKEANTIASRKRNILKELIEKEIYPKKVVMTAGIREGIRIDIYVEPGQDAIIHHTNLPNGVYLHEIDPTKNSVGGKIDEET